MGYSDGSVTYYDVTTRKSVKEEDILDSQVRFMKVSSTKLFDYLIIVGNKGRIAVVDMLGMEVLFRFEM